MGDLNKRRSFFVSPRTLLLLLTVAAYATLLYWYLNSRRKRRVAIDPSSCSSEALLSWSRRKGIRFGKVTLADFVYEDPTADAEYWLDTIRERRGLLAIEDIRSGETVIDIPWSACLTTQHIKKSSHPLSAMASDAHNTLDSTELIALFLLYEYHQSDSEWAPYLCLLPRKLTSSLFWNEETLSAASSGLRNRTAMLKEMLFYRFKHVVQPLVKERFEALLPPSILTVSNFFWAISTVRSRNWGVDVGGIHLNVIAPLADMINHDPKAGGGGFAIQDKGGEDLAFKLVSGSNFSRGQEVLVSYGNKCNDILFLEYGFAVPGHSLPCHWPEPTPHQVRSSPHGLGAAAADARHR